VLRIRTIVSYWGRLHAVVGVTPMSVTPQRVEAYELLNPDDEAAEGASGAHDLQRGGQRADSPA
jgi:hypothetical protein